MSKIFFVLILFALTSAQAQQTEKFVDVLGEYQEALHLYEQNQFDASSRAFREIYSELNSDKLKSDADYYLAKCAIELGQPQADEMMETFIERHPTSLKTNKAYLEVGKYYFQNRNFNKANTWLSKVNTNSLSRSELKTFHFNYGYTNFRLKNYKEARQLFENVRNDQDYGAQAKYYIGFIAYEENEYESASALFDEARREGIKGNNISYFQSDMNFKLGNFEKAIELGLKQLPKSNARERSQLNKIIGESYFNLKEYAKAIEYLKDYRGDRGKWNNTDYYQLGFAYYETGDFESAIDEFSKIIDGQDFVAQNAYYHLAKAYLKTDKKTQALNAFKNVTEMPYDEQLKKNAYLNYAKLSYEIGNSYQPTPEVLQTYLEKYPDSEEVDVIENLLIDSYLTSKNYLKAISMLEGSRDYTNKLALQKVAYYYGIELFKDNQFQEAIAYFNKSLAQRLDPEYTAKATYWKAEADYALGNYDMALIGYKEFKGMNSAQKLPEYYSIDYNIAYSYFKTKNYRLSASFFEDFIKIERPSQQLHDAYVRLGDARFALGQYWPAMEAYNKAIAMKNYKSDYAFFQKAYSYGFVDRNEQKIESLNAFIDKYSNSIYKDDALYELGNTYVAENKDQEAISAYQNIITNYKQSRYYPKAFSKQALIYFNNENYKAALSKFKQLVSEFPNSQEALQAVQTVRLIYIDMGEIDQYASWVNTLDFVEVADSDIEEATYQAAENKFLDNDTQKAISLFKIYLEEFPTGRNSLKANFYLAQLLYNEGNVQESLSYYIEVINRSSNEFTEESLRRLSQIYLSNENYEEAIETLSRLENEASFSQNILFAQSNLMKAYYEIENYDKALAYAELILSKDINDEEVMSDALVFIARSSLKTGDEARAESAYKEVLEMATGKLKAEALYYDAYFKNKSGEYEASTAVVQDLTKNYSRYREFGVKGLLLMAKNFNALGDNYQATYILENIIKNFQSYPEVISEAEELLQSIKTNAAETNSSVEVDQN
ncbi:tetratricopeptide repeat protein [Psychroflexus sediminis]|uniref:Tetratricopeptide repeat-containing protein n=1 Tax=Psychroflexus sediminis TaxID=470826 RepID=A0A1G7VFL7_9FLAO|nr:tetratricopeptide repeat protein [Psychroflexus sediminis]SDG57730.1 Tetratricopeptide repeat-containing protein [Psychroflexus sediminis]